MSTITSRGRAPWGATAAMIVRRKYGREVFEKKYPGLNEEIDKYYPPSQESSTTSSMLKPFAEAIIKRGSSETSGVLSEEELRRRKRNSVLAGILTPSTGKKGVLG